MDLSEKIMKLKVLMLLLLKVKFLDQISTFDMIQRDMYLNLNQLVYKYQKLNQKCVMVFQDLYLLKFKVQLKKSQSIQEKKTLYKGDPYRNHKLQKVFDQLEAFHERTQDFAIVIKDLIYTTIILQFYYNIYYQNKNSTQQQF
ncbi:unnamed protein product [Paramecium sonneborni]|uniref:Transmembrane protein n=1 Tax=Paramecium sonneborni TaxID=65129 RepID=A0A8S1LE95_9CILI|nr:unnamed protein product [Paramecium sonneborni]CAD8063066.1 unnamed protein product [Paramecium sonneborni]